MARYLSLPGDQIDTVEPRKWGLVAREMALPSEEDGPNRWSVDHLFLDQDGIPTIVEVKRSADTRNRREVVGQMLDYAANGVRYWPVETHRARFEAASANRATTSASCDFDFPEAPFVSEHPRWFLIFGKEVSECELLVLT